MKTWINLPLAVAATAALASPAWAENLVLSGIVDAR